MASATQKCNYLVKFRIVSEHSALVLARHMFEVQHPSAVPFTRKSKTCTSREQGVGTIHVHTFRN